MPRELMSTRAFWVLICVTTCVNLNEWVRLWVLWPKHYWSSEYSTTILCVLYWILVIINTCTFVRFLDENVRNLFLSNHFTILQKKWKNHVFVSAKKSTMSSFTDKYKYHANEWKHYKKKQMLKYKKFKKRKFFTTENLKEKFLRCVVVSHTFMII